MWRPDRPCIIKFGDGPVDGTSMHVCVDLSVLASTRNGTSADSWNNALCLQTSPTIDRVTVRADASMRVAAIGADPRMAQLDWVTRTDANADLVYVPHQLSLPAFTHLRSRTRAPIVIRWLDFIALRRPDYFRSRKAWARNVAGAALVLNSADGILWLSDYVARQADVFGWTRDAPSAVISTGVDHLRSSSVSEPSAYVLRKVCGRTDAMVLMVASAMPHKRRVLAIDAVNELRRSGFSVNLIIVGSEPAHGSTMVQEQERVKELHLGDRVVHLGAVGGGDLQWLYRNASVSLVLSEEEGFGIVPFESATSGCPVVSSLGGALGELLPNGFGLAQMNASTVAEAIERLVKDPEAALANVHGIGQAAERFTWSEVGAPLSSFLRSVAAGGTVRQSALRQYPRAVHRLGWGMGTPIGLR